MADFLRAYVPGPAGADRPRHRRARTRHAPRPALLHLGQRRGIGIPSNTDHEAYVVVGKRAADRALLVAFDRLLGGGVYL
jgi:tRNA-specific 2-thiouridylase